MIQARGGRGDLTGAIGEGAGVPLPRGGGRGYGRPLPNNFENWILGNYYLEGNILKEIIHFMV